MKKLITYSIVLAALAAAMPGCKKDNKQNINPDVSKIASDGFKFTTTQNVNINLTLKAPNDEPIVGAVVSFYDPANVETGTALFKAVTNSNGNLTATANVPSYLTQLVIDPAYTGLIRNVTANITGGGITATIGGRAGFSGIVPEMITFSSINGSGSKQHINGAPSTIGFPGSYASLADAVVNSTIYPANLGRPAYLETTGDVISASLLSYVNASLPEGTSLVNSHPAYLTNGISSVINVTANNTDIYVTFVSEGAGYTNVLAYYSYPTNNPPQSVSSITNAKYVFPNASAFGSGGGLNSGDKVKQGTFSAGTSIGYILLQNGFQGTTISTSVPAFYSQDSFNPETNTTLQHHNVTLYDDVNKVFITGFEDLDRQTPRPGRSFAADNDFNDLVIYTTASVNNSISNTGIPVVDHGGDTDGDGVPDVLDAFPNDPAKAYISYFPSQNTFAQIAFEDNWPKKGDYDLNDLVVNYRYTFVSNARNQVVTLQGDYSVAAAGANYKSGFGVQLPVSSAAVQSVTGQRAISNYIQLASNGVESGQAKAVIIPFDNFNALINNTDGSSIINTLLSKDKVTSTTATVLVTFTSPIEQTSLNASTLNPFLISNLRRGYEIHLPGYAATDKADRTLFGTFDDASIAKGVNYIGTDNGPWAINYNTTFSYPVETANISAAYPHFLGWANSGGTLFTDWYVNLGSGYRDNTKIYSK